jgi:guanidinopropionase
MKKSESIQRFLLLAVFLIFGKNLNSIGTCDIEDIKKYLQDIELLSKTKTYSPGDLYWWGIPTFFSCKTDSDPENCDIAIIGVPHSSGNGTTERDQHLGPRAVRNISNGKRLVHNELNINPWTLCRINDLGDVPLPSANNNEKCIEDITKFYGNIDNAKTYPVSIGGDHSITGAILQAISHSKSKITDGKKAALVHFDAHTDSYEQMPHFLGAEKSAAHWASYLVHQGNVDPHKSVQIGMRGHTRDLNWYEPSKKLGYEVITMKQFKELGIEKTIKKILDRVGDSPVYITFDLDCLDVTVAPGVSNLEAGFQGFYMDEVCSIIRALKDKKIIGGDVVCLMPTKDSPNNITSFVASSIAFEMIALIANNFKSRAS